MPKCSSIFSTAQAKPKTSGPAPASRFTSTTKPTEKRQSRISLLAALLCVYLSAGTLHAAPLVSPSNRAEPRTSPLRRGIKVPKVTSAPHERLVTELAKLSLGYESQDGRQVTFYTPRPKQAIFHAAKTQYRLFGGSSGPGKTTALLAECIARMHCTDDRSKAMKLHSLLLRRTNPQLDGSLLKGFRELVPRDFYNSFNESKKVVTWSNGATTKFGSMQHEKDVWNYQGHEYTYVGWDELTQFTLTQWETLKPWNRCPLPEYQSVAGMDGATNSVGIGSEWVRAMFGCDGKKRASVQMREPHLYRPDDYTYIPALVWDNPTYANDTRYIENLRSLPLRLRQALLEGRWDVSAGAYFDCFDPATMSVRWQDHGMRSWWPGWLSGDWGFEHDAAFYWHRSSPTGQVITYRELVTHHLSAVELAHKIVELSVAVDATDPNVGGEERLETFYLSPDAFAHRTKGSSIAEQMGNILRTPRGETCPVCRGIHKLPYPVQADNERVSGWMMWYSMMKHGQWIVDPECERLIQCIPILGRDEKNPEDVLKTAGDDPGDATRYGIYSRLKGKRPPLGERIAARVTATDPTARAMQARKAFVQESKSGRGVFIPASGRNIGRIRTWKPR